MSNEKMTPEESEKLIRRNLQEVVEVEDGAILKILKERPLKIYWGTATTGAPHMGYFVPMLKIGDFLKAGCQVTILFANVHACLDNLKSTFEEVGHRLVYYEFLIKEMLKLFKVPLDRLKFVRGSEFQLSKEYTMDMYKMSALCTVRNAKRCGAEVVKQKSDPLLSGLLYPLLQSLDEEYLGVDCQFGGVDQRKIFMHAREYLPKLGYKKRIHLMNPMIPGLTKSGKMSSSIPSSKIDFFDDDEKMKKKIMKAYSIDGQVDNNCLLAILKYILFVKIETDGRKFVVKRDEKYGGDLVYNTYEEVEKDFAEQKLLSADLKIAVANEIISLITPLRKTIIEHQDLFIKAYGSLPNQEEEGENEKEGKKKEEKKKEKKEVKKTSKKKKKERHYGFDQLLLDWVEEKKGEFPGEEGWKLSQSVRKKFNLGKVYGQMKQEEKDKLHQKYLDNQKKE